MKSVEPPKFKNQPRPLLRRSSVKIFEIYLSLLGPLNIKHKFGFQQIQIVNDAFMHIVLPFISYTVIPLCNLLLPLRQRLCRLRGPHKAQCAQARCALA